MIKMKKLKKILLVLMLFALVFTLTGCGSDSIFSDEKDNVSTLSINKVGQGDIVEPNGTGNFEYQNDTIVEVKTKPAVDKKLLYWDGKSADKIVKTKTNNWQINMDSDKTVKAVFSDKDLFVSDSKDQKMNVELVNFNGAETSYAIIFPRDDEGKDYKVENLEVIENANNNSITNRIKEVDLPKVENKKVNVKKSIYQTGKFRNNEKKFLEKHEEYNDSALKNAQSTSTEINYNVGDEESFTVTTSFATLNEEEKDFVLKKESNHAYIWVPNDEDDEDDAEIKQESINKMAAKFEDVIHPKLTNTFGREPNSNTFNVLNKTGKKTHIVFTPIDYAAGYFWSGDLYPKSQVSSSNERKMFYVSTYSQLNEQISTLAHEFQHMLFYNEEVLSESNNAVTDTWINEGLAVLAEDIVGYGYKNGYSYKHLVEHYLNNPTDTSLLNWNTNLASGDFAGTSNYAASYLFTRYMYDRFGKGIIDYMNMSSKPAKADIENYTGISFKNIYSNWIIAMTGVSDKEKYSYSSIELPEINMADLSPNNSIKDTNVKGWGFFISKISNDTGNDISINADVNSSNFWMQLKRN
jgi:hypothetical protein